MPAVTSFVLSRARVETMLAARGTDYASAAFPDPVGIEIVAWLHAGARSDADGLRVEIETDLRDASGWVRTDQRVLLFTQDAVRLVEANLRPMRGNPRQDRTTTLWRIEDADGLGPFRGHGGGLAASMSLVASSGRRTDHYDRMMPIPEDDGIEMRSHHRCAAASPAQLRAWFPPAVRRALARLGFRIVRLSVEPGAAQIGAGQAIYDPSRTRMVRSRRLLAAA